MTFVLIFKVKLIDIPNETKHTFFAIAGLLVVAKDDVAHNRLCDQFKEHTVSVVLFTAL